MKYMIMLKADPANQADRMPTDEELNAMGAYNEEVIAAGAMLAGEGLHPVETGSWVSFDGDERVVTDGPFTESKELIAGFDIVEVADQAEAIEIASRHPMARFGRVEVREFWPFEG